MIPLLPIMTKRLFHVGPALPALGTKTRPRYADQPDWVQANPDRIRRSLARALAKPSGGWYVVDATRQLSGRTLAPRRYVVRGESLVAFRDAHGGIVVGPTECPHMGADLSCGRVEGGKVVCPWHGLALGADPHGTWKPLPVHDDGVLFWVRLPPAPGDAPEPPTAAPILAPRPERFVDGVIRAEIACEPSDVIANRLDPWHGAYFHPHSFARLAVTHEDEEKLEVRVSYRIAGPVCSEVDATFHCPDPRTIVMTIVEGEGRGSVVETHATPIGPGRTAMVEATLATSERSGFPWVAKRLARWMRPAIEARAARLWVEDAAYAERMFALRQRDG